jgi:Tol biopolymer transport system component
MDLTNYRTEALTHGNNHFRLPLWSPDCSRLAFTSFGSDPNVHILNLEDSQTRRVGSQQEISVEGASWSPDSHFLATYIPVPSPNNNQKRFDLGIVDTKTNKMVTRINGPIAYPFSEVDWNSDSDKIYYAAMRDTSSFDIYVTDLNDSIETPLIQREFHDVYPMLSPDGKFLSFLQSSDQAAYLVGLLDLSSKNIEMMTTNPKVISATLWLDNQRLLLSEYNPSNDQTIYYVLDIQTQVLREISRFDGQFLAPKILQP